MNQSTFVELKRRLRGRLGTLVTLVCESVGKSSRMSPWFIVEQWAVKESFFLPLSFWVGDGDLMPKESIWYPWLASDPLVALLLRAEYPQKEPRAKIMRLGIPTDVPLPIIQKSDLYIKDISCLDDGKSSPSPAILPFSGIWIGSWKKRK